MTTQELMQAIQTISTDILGKKIDIVGMDMCMMSMLEIGYELSPFVHYMVGSQDCELEYGWDYEAIFKQLGTTIFEPADLARAIVEAYRYFYSTYAIRGTYTHAATALAYIPTLIENFNQVITYLSDHLESNPQDIAKLKVMRLEIPRFCLIPMYTDLHSVYEIIETILSDEEAIKTLRQGKNIIKNAVINHCEGAQRIFAQGLSIYFPVSHIDSSYYQCQFSQKTRWLEILKMITGE